MAVLKKNLFLAKLVFINIYINYAGAGVDRVQAAEWFSVAALSVPVDNKAPRHTDVSSSWA